MAGRKLFIVSSINSGERIVKRMISMHLMRESEGAGLRKERAPRLRGRKKIKRAAWGDKTHKKAGGKLRFPPAWTHKNLLVRCHRLDDLDFAAVVGTALRAHSVRQMQSTALGACHQSGSCQLPYGRTSLIASLLGYFSLRDCHVDTSLVLTA